MTFTPTTTNTPTATATPTLSPTPSLTPTAGLPLCVDPFTVSGRLPSDDTYIDQNKPTTALGTEDKFKVRPDNAADLRGLLRFDLNDIPAEAQVTSARLFIYELTTKAEQIMYIYRVTGDWSESITTWNTPWINPGGDFDGSTAYALLIPNQKDCSISLDITSLVQLWVDGTYPNYGVLLYSRGQNHIIDFASKEDSAHPERAPRLEVTYIQTAPSLSSWTSADWWLSYFIKLRSIFN